MLITTAEAGLEAGLSYTICCHPAALDDLRLMIDSLDAIEGDILVVLGMFRSRLEPRLMAQNIKFDWQVTDLPAVPNLSPHEVLQILRILQEAVTNVIKHANADVITVKTLYTGGEDDAGVVSIEVRDNGKGINAYKSTTGYGYVERLKSGALFGLISLIDHGTRAATCKAQGPATVGTRPRAAFDLLCNANATLAQHFQFAIARQLAKDMRIYNQALSALVASDDTALFYGAIRAASFEYRGIERRKQDRRLRQDRRRKAHFWSDYSEK